MAYGQLQANLACVASTHAASRRDSQLKVFSCKGSKDSKIFVVCVSTVSDARADKVIAVNETQRRNASQLARDSVGSEAVLRWPSRGQL